MRSVCEVRRGGLSFGRKASASFCSKLQPVSSSAAQDLEAGGAGVATGPRHGDLQVEVTGR